MVALSVSTSQTTSPFSILSPSCLLHDTIVPSSIVGERASINIFSAIILLLTHTAPTWPPLPPCPPTAGPPAPRYGCRASVHLHRTPVLPVHPENQSSCARPASRYASQPRRRARTHPPPRSGWFCVPNRKSPVRPGDGLCAGQEPPPQYLP